MTHPATNLLDRADAARKRLSEFPEWGRPALDEQRARIIELLDAAEYERDVEYMRAESQEPGLLEGRAMEMIGALEFRLSTQAFAF